MAIILEHSSITPTDKDYQCGLCSEACLSEPEYLKHLD